MNVKISADGLCFKISADELKTLLSGQPLRESLNVGATRLGLCIHPLATDGDMTVTCSGDTIRLCVAPHKVQELADMGRSREGVSYKAGDVLIDLLVDFRTQKRDPNRPRTRSPGREAAA